MHPGDRLAQAEMPAIGIQRQPLHRLQIGVERLRAGAERVLVRTQLDHPVGARRRALAADIRGDVEHPRAGANRRMGGHALSLLGCNPAALSGLVAHFQCTGHPNDP